MLKPVEKPIKFVKNLETKGKSFPITHVSAVIDDNGESVKSIIDSLKNKGSLTKVTWLELKDKRDAGKLIPGSLYRITDYNCTTTQESTRSAGHQFDIVLLALSEDKLAEEGWAMMHDNVYDVTFADGVTKKCYVNSYYFTDGESEGTRLDIVDVDTKLGCWTFQEMYNIIVNEDTKTVVCTDLENGPFSTDLENDDIIGNYFQNSNLSAWKVWYCLDNDKSRFAWADDSVDEDSPAFITILGGKGEIYTYYRDSADDLSNLFAWKEGDGLPKYTASQTPSVGDTIYYEDGTDADITVNSFTPAHEGTGLPNGRGVIYRLIDEWNNDVGYDFKNIQFIRPTTDGEYDPEGDDTWVYTFNKDNGDSSNEGVCACYNNYISPYTINNTLILSDNVLTIVAGSGTIIKNSKNCTIIGDNVKLDNCNNCIVGMFYGTLMGCEDFTVREDDEGIYIRNKKVLTEE